jgi:hypothetical protein
MPAEMYLLHVETLLRMRAENDPGERRAQARFVPIAPTRSRDGRSK